MIRLAPLAFAVAVLCACGEAAPKGVAPPEETAIVIAEPERTTVVQSPSGAVSVVIEGDGQVLMSAGFLRRSVIARVETPSYVAWAPDSRRFFINDSGSASWSAFRLFSLDGRGAAVEFDAVRKAVVAELARRNGCAPPPGLDDVRTDGMAWAADGAQVYVLAQVRRQTGACAWRDVEYLVAAADADSGRLLEVAVGVEARRRYPSLPWAPVTAP
jgi:hypothetical protein